ncbi:MAG: hypothetical protein M1831_002955 [Alyxoria varia]|nr:MAG: hypothetical protein M1831_002955 [Alyxoria varia]
MSDIQSGSSPHVYSNNIKLINLDPQSFLGLPKEDRLAAYDQLFSSTAVDVYPGKVTYFGSYIKDDGDLDGDPSTQLAENYHTLEEKPDIEAENVLATVGDPLERILGTNDQIKDEARTRYHSLVTYIFPNSIAFMDVLSQWKEDEIQNMRHAYVIAYPIPIFPIGEASAFHTHFFADVLPMYPALGLETLTVELVWKCNGSWSQGAIPTEIACLEKSPGWKKLRIIAPPLQLSEDEWREFEEAVSDFREGHPRSTVSKTSVDDHQSNMQKGDEDSKTVALELTREDFPDKGRLEDNKFDGRMFRDLLAKMSWSKIRGSGVYLLEDGTRDAEALL